MNIDGPEYKDRFRVKFYREGECRWCGAAIPTGNFCNKKCRNAKIQAAKIHRKKKRQKAEAA